MELRLWICLMLLAMQYCKGLVNQCHDGEVEYIPGENYIKGNCTLNCSCSEVRYVGHVEQCVPLCPSVPAKCWPGTIPRFYQEDIDGSKCTCRKWRCVKAGLCQYDNQKFSANQSIITSNCGERCQCHHINGRAITKCTPLCPIEDEPKCHPKTEILNEFQRSLNDTNCTCTKKRCVSAGLCQYDNQIFSANQSITTSNCRERCQCHHINGAAITKCKPFCPIEEDLKCHPHSERLTEFERSLNDTNCTCSKKRCVLELIHKLVNRNVSFKSVNYPRHYISYNKDSKKVRIAVPSDRFISTWLITPGLCGDGISFKAIWEPNSYLRQKDTLAYVHPFQSTQVYQSDACFLPVEGNIGVGTISFESVKHARYYLRHQYSLIKLHAYENHDLYLKDSTFSELPGLSP